MSQRRRCLFNGLMVVSGVILMGIIATAVWLRSQSGALWEVVSQRCLANPQATLTAPCTRVNSSQGYVIIKDRQGPLQYLLLPSQRMSGIEDPRLLSANSANFFALAWDERKLLSQRYGSTIDDRALSLAINSVSGRTQDQLHLHISCLAVGVAQKIRQLRPTLSTQWQAITLADHPYQARLLNREQLLAQSPFQRIARELPGAAAHMGDYGIALLGLGNDQFVLVAQQARGWRGIRGSSEELQEHQCQILSAIKG